MYKVTCRNVYKYDDMKRSEHMAVRTTVGWYYWTHQLVEVTGDNVAEFLDYLYPNNIANLAPSRARYTTMLDEKGLIIDDVVVFRMEQDKFWISTLYAYRLMGWIDAHKGDRNISCEHITKKWDMYAVQGPRSKDMVNALVSKNVDDQKFFQILDNEIDGIPVKINRGGYTGEKLGYEIYVAPEQSKALEQKLAETAKQFDGKQVEEFQIMTLSLPTEKGYFLMTDIGRANPLEVGLDGGINWEKEFIGKEALLKVRQEGAKRVMLGFITDEDDIHIQSRERGGPGDPILLNGEEVGRATKLSYSFVLDRTIGFALVDKALAKIGDRVTINDNAATLTERIFV